MIAITILQPPALEIDKLLFGPPRHRPPAHVVQERRIVWNLIHHMQAAGFKVRAVDDGEEQVKVYSPRGAMELIANVDVCLVYFSRFGAEREEWIKLVGGNGTDVLSDYGTRGDGDAWDKAIEAFDAEDYA